MRGPLFTGRQKHDLSQRLGLPIRVFAGLMVSLATMVLLGALPPFPGAWIVELLVLGTMIATVLLFSMELTHEPPLIRLYSALGFCWLGVLFAMTLIDYLTRGRWPL